MTVSQIQLPSVPTETKRAEAGPMHLGLLQDLLEAALNVARVDESVVDANWGAPALKDVDANKWHDVSLRALSWTRTALASKQDTVLKQMRDQAKLRCKVLSPDSGLGEKQSQCKPAPKSLLPTLSPDAAPFCPGPPGVWILPSPEAKVHLIADEESNSMNVAAACADAGLESIGSLREDLIRLREYDADRCLIVRRIKRLGLASGELLREHFQLFGSVSEVLVAHSFEKKSAKCRCDRIRPAALGFIIMEDADAARTAISAGPTLEVANVQISVKKFEAFEDDGADHDEITK